MTSGTTEQVVKMKNRRVTPSLLWAMAATLSACSLLLSWDPAGQPCDSQGRCATGYSCVDRRCVFVGGDGGSSCGSCPAGQRCLEGVATCIQDTCATRFCHVGTTCVADAGVTACQPVAAPAIGHSCTSDSQCLAGGDNRHCYRGAVPDVDGGLRPGICVEKCSNGFCLTPSTYCTSFSLGLDAGRASLCLPDRLLFHCVDDSQCANEGFVCTVYDNPALGPATFCDLPVVPRAARPGEACSATGNDGGLPCANGLCVPRQPEVGVTSRCGEPCDTNTCSGGAQCMLVELDFQAPVRQVPMCVTGGAGRCQDCTFNASACGPDAPHCTLYGTRKVCLSSCTPSSGTPETPECSPGFQCQATPSGSRCVPVSGSCP